MNGQLTARPNIRGLRIDVGRSFVSPDPRPGLRLVRRRTDHPTTPDDGLVVLDAADLFGPSGAPWLRVDRARFLLVNSAAEGGLVQAEIALFHDAADPAPPARVVVRVYDGASGEVAKWVVDAPTAVVITPGPRLDDATTSVDVQAANGGTAVVGAADFRWTPAGQPYVAAGFDGRETQVTTGFAAPADPSGGMRASFVTRIGAQEIRAITYEEAPLDEVGERVRSFEVADQEPARRTPSTFAAGLEPETVFCYALWISPSIGSTAWTTGEGMSASATALGRYGMADQLYELLPAIHRYNDAPPDGGLQAGQLRRFLDAFGAVLDQGRSSAEALASRSDVLSARPDVLPHLSRWIGWEPDQTLPSRGQRQDILFAPEIYRSVGTLPGIRRMIEYTTGWTCELKELVHNVFLTNAEDASFSWQVFQGFGEHFAQSVQVTTRAPIPAGALDVRPAPVIVGSDIWLFWEAGGGGRNEIRVARVLAPNPAPAPTEGQPAIDAAGQPAGVHDRSPYAIRWKGQTWLFWSSDRAESSRIFVRAFSDLATLTGGPPQQITFGPGEDTSPAALVDASDGLRLFWRSARGGHAHVWTMRATWPAGAPEPVWSAPEQLTTGRVRDASPMAALDSGGVVRVFFARDLGGNTELWWTRETAGGWLEPTSLSARLTDDHGAPLPGGELRDEAPWPFAFGPTLGLAFHSNRGGRWRVWLAILPPEGGPEVYMTTTMPWGAFDAKEPAFVFDEPAQVFGIFFRSRKGNAPFLSRTWTADSEAAKRTLPDDRWHYIYDTRRSDASFYARGAVGVYMTPPVPLPEDEEERVALVKKTFERAKAIIEPFRPLPVRFVWFSRASEPPRWDAY